MLRSVEVDAASEQAPHGLTRQPMRPRGLCGTRGCDDLIRVLFAGIFQGNFLAVANFRGIQFTISLHEARPHTY
jgi:hypothetical protein